MKFNIQIQPQIVKEVVKELPKLTLIVNEGEVKPSLKTKPTLTLIQGGKS